MSLTALAVVVAFIAGCILAIARHPIFGLITYVGVFYLHPPSRWWGQGILLDVRWSFIAAVITLLAIGISKGRRIEPDVGFLRQGLVIGFVSFLVWIAVQFFWALDTEAHKELLLYYVKFLIVMYLIYKAVDTEEHLRWFLWSHVLGCFYLGWIAFTSYGGGRFESFGGPGIGEANAGALQMVTGVLVAAALFLSGQRLAKVTVVGVMPVILNAVVTTVSRSGFLALGIGGLFFNLFTPVRFRKPVRILSLLGVLLLALLTNETYWARMETIKYTGDEVAGIDTGAGRLEIITAQWRMFAAHPMGCGHMCTTYLSPGYLDSSRLSEGARASHNTFMSMLVDHGIPGGIVFALMVGWAYRQLRFVLGSFRNSAGFLPVLFPAIAGSIGAIIVADMFVQYPKFEARFWFLSIVMVLSGWASKERLRRSNAPRVIESVE